MMKRYVTTGIKISFVLYLSLLFLILFVRNRGFGMNLTIWEYAQVKMNLVPFRTISEYMDAIRTGSMNLDIPIKNLGGNLLMFLPMGMYLPYFFQKLRNWKSFLGIMIPMLLIIEVIQFLGKCGSFDIDDFILNLTGAVIGFLVYDIIISKNNRK